jgi:hypothetical protein
MTMSRDRIEPPNPARKQPRAGGKPPRLDGTSDRLVDLPGQRRPSSTQARERRRVANYRRAGGAVLETLSEREEQVEV